MDSAPLVTEDIEWGSSLVDAIREAGLSVEIAGWVHDAELDSWRLVLATSMVNEMGALETYRRVSQVAREAGLPTSFLSQVTVTSSNDSVVSHLRAVKEASEKAGPDFPVLSGVNLPNSEHFYLYDEKEIAFEKAVLSALQRVTPSRAVIRRAEREFHQDPGFDFIVDDGQRRFLVEAKASSRPINRAHLKFFMTNFRHRPPVLVVANTQLVSHTADWLQQQPDLFFVTWRSPEDDQELKASVAALLSGAPSFGVP